MTCYIITYDLNKGTKNDYTDLYGAIKSYGTRAHINDSVRAIVTEQSASQIRDYLGGIIDNEDSIFVIKSGKVAAWKNVQCTNERLKNNL